MNRNFRLAVSSPTPPPLLTTATPGADCFFVAENVSFPNARHVWATRATGRKTYAFRYYATSPKKRQRSCTGVLKSQILYLT